jgi:hypothetical protein
MSETIAQHWLQSIIKTAANKNHSEHMDLISRRVSLQGVPGFENIGYDDWSAQTQYEFENNILKSVSYSGFKLMKATSKHIMFKTFETIEANDKTINAQAIEVLLERENDEKWRLVQERILPPDEAQHDGLIAQ